MFELDTIQIEVDVMASDFSRFRKLESLPASLQRLNGGERERVVVLVKIREGSAKPSYLDVRTAISKQIFSAEVGRAQMEKLERDPSVESFSVSRPVPLV
jgi:hypothetical protein